MIGKVTWWNPRRRHGRVKSDADDRTYCFAHTEVAAAAALHVFRRGETVSFDAEETAGGRRALRVRPTTP